jgi:hypothetical protein
MVTERVFESPDIRAFVSNVQALSLIARKRINTGLGYSTQINKYSRLDTSAILRLNANTSSGKSDVVIGLYYRAIF